jgi:hypothetical protein
MLRIASARKAKYRKWTETEEYEMMRLYKLRFSLLQIADHFETDQQQINNKLQSLIRVGKLTKRVAPSGGIKANAKESKRPHWAQVRPADRCRPG